VETKLGAAFLHGDEGLLGQEWAQVHQYFRLFIQKLVVAIAFDFFEDSIQSNEDNRGNYRCKSYYLLPESSGVPRKLGLSILLFENNYYTLLAFKVSEHFERSLEKYFEF